MIGLVTFTNVLALSMFLESKYNVCLLYIKNNNRCFSINKFDFVPRSPKMCCYVPAGLVFGLK